MQETRVQSLGLEDPLEKRKMKVLVTQLCKTLCDSMDWSLPGSYVHRILQARILEYFLLQRILLTQGSNPGLPYCRFFTVWATRESHSLEQKMATHCSILPGKCHGQRSLAGYSSWGHKRVRHNLDLNNKNSQSRSEIFKYTLACFFKMCYFQL